MKISREWLQTYFENPLPDAAALGEALTFHAFEIESIEGDVLDVKVTPNRGHDCLSHRGIAKEISAILDIPIKGDSLRHLVSLEPRTDTLHVVIENPELCRRFTAAHIKGIRVGPSPEWLRQRLEAVGQRSINNIVDATNFVMLDMGQPLHAFDAGKLTHADGTRALTIRAGKHDEKMRGLDDREYTLTPAMLAIADGHTGEAVSIAGIKGGKPTGIDETTTDIILEAANWDGVHIRKTSQALKLRTDASARFEQSMSPEIAPYGLRAAADLILQIAGGEVSGFVDEYPRPQVQVPVSISVSCINKLLGTALAEANVEDVFRRLDLSHTQEGEVFTITAPFERLDLLIPEDLVEEVARIVGYETVPAVELPPFPKNPEINSNFFASEQKRQDLTSKGYSEVYTSIFADTGERAVANKVDSVHPFLRSNLTDALTEALVRNVRNKDVLGLKEVKLFEIGTVWKDGAESIHIATVGEKEKPEEMQLHPTSAESYEILPVSTTDRYQSFSRYPFIVRDIALWTPAGTEPESVLSVIRTHASELLVRSELFDRFEKNDKLSLAFRLVFQSFERTLTDEEANTVMEKVAGALKSKGFEIR